MEFRVLGPLTLSLSGGEIRIRSARQRTVLAMLLLERNHVVPMHRLIEAVWPADPPATARSQVQICVSALRRVVAEPGDVARIRTVSPGYELQVAEGAVDLDVFTGLVRSAQEDRAAHRLEAAVEGLRSSLTLWRGEPFADVDSGLVRSAVTGLTEQRLSAVELCIELELELGRHEEASQQLATLVGEHPFRERLRSLQMLALHRSGRKQEALAVYRDTRRVLVEELGLEPGAELRGLERSILADDPALAPPVGPGGTAAPAVPRQLPADVPDFTGRTELIARLRALLTSNADTSAARSSEIIAFTGRAGVGKTALAVRLAHEIAAEYPDGQLFARLHGEEARPVGPGRVLERFLRSLGVVGNQVPESTDERSDLFRSLIAGRRLLILLDDAGDETQVLPLLPGMNGGVVMVTSRRRLAALAGARRVEVDVLDQPASVRLLAAHSGRQLAGAELEAARLLADRCGGLPLAVRISAARLASRPHWSVADLAARLADGPRRLDELRHGEFEVRSSVALTYHGLSPPAQRLFRLLGVVDMAEFPAWITAPLLDADVGGTSELLESLVDARMVDVAGGRDEVRYRLHDLLRVYARERLAEEEPATERTAALRRLLGCLLHLVEQAHRRIYGGDYTVLHSPAPRWSPAAAWVSTLLAHPIGWLDSERGTIVEAVGQAVRAGLHEQAWDLAMSAVVLFEQGMYFEDWRETHELALAAARHHGDRRGEAVMRYSLGALSVAQQRPGEAVAHLSAADRIFQELGLTHGTALVLRNLAFIDRMQGRTGDAVRGYEQSLPLLRAAGDRVAEAHVLTGLSHIHLERGELPTAQRLLEEALAICRTAGNHRVAAQAGHGLGEVCLAQGRLDDARRHFEAVLRAVRGAGDRIGEAYARSGLAAVELRRGRTGDAASQLATGLELARHVGEHMVEARLLMTLGEVYLADGRPTVAVGPLTDALRTFRQLGAARWQAQALDLLGTAHAAGGDREASLRAWREALGLLDTVDPAAGRQLTDRLTARIHEATAGG